MGDSREEDRHGYYRAESSLVLYAGVLGRSVSAGGGPRLSASRQMAGIGELYVNAIGVGARYCLLESW